MLAIVSFPQWRRSRPLLGAAVGAAAGVAGASGFSGWDDVIRGSSSGAGQCREARRRSAVRQGAYRGVQIPRPDPGTRGPTSCPHATIRVSIGPPIPRYLASGRTPERRFVVLKARRKTVACSVGTVAIGSDHPIVVQSMTNTDTADAAATADQVVALAGAGSQLVRVTVNNDAAAAAVPGIIRRAADRGVTVPIIGDFHYNGHLLLTKHAECARALDQYLLTTMMDENGRRAEPRDARDVYMEAMIESALRSAALAEETGLTHDRIIISAKISKVQDLLDCYRKLAGRCDYPLHVGLTEAGLGMKGIVATTAALSLILAEGIGDTIRVSLTPRPGGDRCEEVHVAQQVLQSLGLRHFTPQVSACPGCGRTTSTFFQKMADDIQGYLREQMPSSGRTYWW